jgi:hypothetical protein
MSAQEYTTGTNEYKGVYTANSVGEIVKVGEILTLGDNTQSDYITTHRHTQTKDDFDLPTYGLTLYPKSNMPCGGYTRVEYTPEQLDALNKRTKYLLGTQLLDIFASNTNCLVLVLETPCLQQQEPEFMVLIRPGMCQSNGAIYWKNKPVSPWYANRCAENDDVLLARKFRDLAILSKLFDDIYGCIQRQPEFKIAFP